MSAQNLRETWAEGVQTLLQRAGFTRHIGKILRASRVRQRFELLQELPEASVHLLQTEAASRCTVRVASRFGGNVAQRRVPKA